MISALRVKAGYYLVKDDCYKDMIYDFQQSI